jgi:hypothetical protein
MATFLLTTEPALNRKNMLMKKTTFFLCTLFVILSKSFSQGDSIPNLPALLPLQVMTIDAKVLNKNVQLIWTVSSNEDAKNFEIERADDGAAYKKIGGRLPNGSSGTVAYEFVDAMPKKEIVYSYRVKINAKDGTSTFSELRFIKVDDEIIRCKLKQNPVRNTIDAQVISAEAVNIQVSVYTNYGQKVLAETAKLATGINNLSFSSQNLHPGIHRLVLETGSERKVISFVKE